MKTAKEIFDDARKIYEDIPDYKTILEVNCFMSLRILLKQFQNNQISKEMATNEKTKIFRIYEQNKTQFKFKEKMHNEYVASMEKIEDIKKMLKSQLKEHSKYSLDTALKLIEFYSNERWID